MILLLCTQRCYGRNNLSPKIYKPLVVYRFYYMVLFHFQTRRHMIIWFIYNPAFILFMMTPGAQAIDNISVYGSAKQLVI